MVLWLLGVQPQGTQAGTLRVNEAKGCGNDVIAFWGRSEALPTKYNRHMDQESDFNILHKVRSN